MNLDFSKLSGIITDKTLAMVAKESGFVALHYSENTSVLAKYSSDFIALFIKTSFETYY